MAKLSFSKLGLNKNTEVINLPIGDQTVEVKQYLPVAQKLELIANVINASSEDQNYPNPVKMYTYTIIEIIKFYTNINFTEKQLEDPAKLFDLIAGNRVDNLIIGAIPEAKSLFGSIREISDAIYAYKNSAYGILDSLKTDYANLDFATSDLAQKFNNPEQFALLQEVLTKLG